MERCEFHRAKNAALSGKHGVGLEERKRLHAKQRGQCAICGKKIPLIGKDSHVDHSWWTGKVRGMLCSACNRGLSCFKDNEAFLRIGACYLEAV